MKIGIVLRGLSYDHGSKGFVDFRMNVNNFMTNIYEPLCEKHEVSVYVSSYPHSLMDQLTKLYKVKKLELMEKNGSDQFTTFLGSLKMLKNEDLDFVVITRFDLQFMNKITDLNIDYSKCNFTHKIDPPEARWEEYEFVSDLMMCFNMQYLETI